MTISKKKFNGPFQTVLAIFASIAVVAGFVYAATTIGTNISIDGNLTVSGTSATSTFSTGGLTVGTNQFVVQKTSGNIGIGTTSPWGLLSVNPNGISGTEFVVGSSTKTDFVVTNGGFVGIGTTNPSDAGFVTSKQLNSRFIELNRSGVAGWNLGVGAAGDFFVEDFDFNARRLTIQYSTGNIGIGTTSPAQLLSVAGDAYIAGAGTTTLNLKTTTASKGTCIEMFDSGGAVRRLYINAAGVITVEAGTCK